jgi:catechol 2,3-dioxygenase-like lactoylglutathione lyase family enzyme
MPGDTPAISPLVSAIAGFRLVTADLPGLTRFYRDVLGFAVAGLERAISGDDMRLLGLHGSGRCQALRLGNELVTIEQFDPPGRPYPADGNAASLWFQHLALVVDDMRQAYERVREAAPISDGGPEHLPVSAGGVDAYKFRDPDGHPLELLRFPDEARPISWQHRTAAPGQIGAGIDHSAMSVADADASVAFYCGLGLEPGERTLNHGPKQHYLDNLRDVQVSVVPMQPRVATPHVELLGYQVPRGAAGLKLRANDIAATRIVWHGTRTALLRDPDGHFQQIASPGQDVSP